jgi:hypothetical protein
MIKSGELIGTNHEGTSLGDQPGLLTYQRPLLDDEAVEYEFYFAEDDSIAHPAVGRLAFLLEQNGVRVRWITTGKSEWTGLEVDNVALEPLNQRGPRPLPFREDEWNSVRVEVIRGDILVRLNDALIYQRPLESGSSTQFGLYRPSRVNTVRVRDVILSGNWPETIPKAFLQDPVAVLSE